MFSKIKSDIEKIIPMSPEAWAQLQDFGKIRQIKKNEYLLKPGQVCQHGYYINSGSLVTTFTNKTGKEIVQGFYIDEDYAFISEVLSYFSGKRSDFQIKAIEDCEIIEFSKPQLDYLMDNYQEFALFFNKITSSSYQNLYFFSAMRLSQTAEDFLLFLYDEHPIYMQRIPDKYIAEFMGISKEWLCKLKKKVSKSILLKR
jgi:CRP-like cAMP-binding protein